MGRKTHPKSYRLPDVAAARLDAYCDLSGLDASEVARAAIAQFIAPALQGMRIVVQDSVQDSVQEKKPSSNHVQVFFKAFWMVVNKKLWPDRVVKTLGDHWDKFKELDAEELGKKYNEYCEAEELAGRESCHPNSWLASGGYKNENEENRQGGPAWDIE